MREIRQSGSEGGVAQTNAPSLPLSSGHRRKRGQIICKPISNRVLRFRSWPATLAGWNDLPYASGSYYFFSGRQRVGSRSGSDPVLNSGSASRGRTKLR